MADLDVTIEDGIATLTMHRPEARNALSTEMRASLSEWLHRVERDDAVRCVVLTGSGDHFMSGGDVKGFADLADMDEDERWSYMVHRIHDLHTVMLAMRRMEKPIIAKVRGAAAGAGVSLAAACDLVIASDDAFFVLAYVNIGTSPDGSSTWFLPKAVGLKKAMEMAMLGDRHSAEDMREAGLVNWVVPAADLDAETERLARRLADGPTRAIGAAKRLLIGSWEQQMERQLQLEAEGFADCSLTDDFAEGVEAFIAKRRPRFTGR